MFKKVFLFLCIIFLTGHTALFADCSSTSSAILTSSSEASVSATILNTSNSGSNTIDGTPSAEFATPSAIPTADGAGSQTPSASVATGDAITTTTAHNTVNTNIVNSQIVYQTINIFLDQSGNIDLSTPITIAERVASESADPTANVVVTNNNYATVNNVVVGSANTGDNTASGSGNLVIDTGNAYSIVSLINKVNLTVVDSTIHIITVNIYGDVHGNILLPQLRNSSSCTSCSVAITVNNAATVNNSVNNTANTGVNTIASVSGSITTGSATSIVNITNILNTLLFNALYEHVYVNTFGTWDGNFLGWDGNSGEQGGHSLDISSLSQGQENNTCSNCADLVSSTNAADVTNDITNTANTGDNTTNGGAGIIKTGNAYAFTSLINLINSSFVRTTGFLGFINIFGSLHGDIGGANYFVTPTPTPTPDNTQQPASPDTTQQKEDGGALSVTTSNNVGAYVLPGDTVTFFANIKNIGTGKVYGTHLHIGLLQDNQEVGGADFSLGDIPAGHGADLSTGLDLSHAINPGTYITRVTVTGTTGDNNTDVSASADSTFLVSGIGYGNTTQQQSQTLQNIPTDIHTQDILGASTKAPVKEDNGLYIILVAILLAYFAIRVLRARQTFISLFAPGKTLKARLNILRLFLL